MSSEIIAARGITEVVHFTTEQGRLGVLDCRALKSSARLTEDQRLEFIFKQNTKLRKDTAWLDYVNLSISRVNKELLRISSGSWHPTLNWCILAFDPVILTHEGVHFTTTNNIYSGVRRGKGPNALEAMFAERVHQYQERYCTRYSGMDPSWTTDVQAEVLYPGQVSTELLTGIYVRTDEDADSVAAQISAVRHPHVPVRIAPELFS